MRKIGTTVLLLALALAGCTVSGDGQLAEPAFTEVATDSPDRNSPNETVTPAAGSPRAFVFESGVLEFGDFDPYALGDDLFDPCTEITEAEYAEAGFEGMTDLPGNPKTDLSACGFDERDGNWEFASSFSNGNLNRAMNKEAGLILDEYRSDIVPEIYVLKGIGGGGCYAQIDTVRGGIGTNVGGTSKVTSMDERCRRAIAMLEDLHTSHSADAH